ncbi:MAG TPA: hypothetical protein VHC22_25380 [Pirellulales bacterium]|nr:hypothetical protein [Pirellulales bacterium]
MLGPLDEPLRIPRVDLALWFFLIAACGGAVYGAREASKGLVKTYTTNRKQIESAEKSLEKAGKPPSGGARPNAAAKKQVDDQNTALRKQLVELWKELYERQRNVLIWPKNADLPVDPSQLKPAEEFPASLCKAYNETVMRAELERVFGKLQLRRPKAAGSAPAIENLPFSDHPDDFDGLVAWNPQSREAILSRYHLEKGIPSGARVRMWQEDLWLFESLVDALSPLNENTTEPLNAVLKQIDVLDVAQWATAAACQNGPTIWLPDGAKPAKSKAPAVPAADGSDEAQVNGRYLDEHGEPLAAGAKQPFAEFKQIFVYLKVVIDQRRLDELLAALANASLPVEVRHLVVQVPTDSTVHPAPPASEAPTTDESEASGATAAEIAPAPSTVGNVATAETTPWDVVVEIGGVVYLYHPADIKKLGTGAAGTPGKRSFHVPVVATAP